jgi:hypothetical protein
LYLDLSAGLFRKREKKMTMQMIKIQPLRKEEVKGIRVLANKELSFPVRVTYNKQKYALGSFNILPSKKIGNEFTEDQQKEVIEFINKNNLYKRDLNLEFATTIFWQGFSYIYQLAQE